LRRAAIVAFLAAASALQASDDRMATLGDGLMCMCSCTQLLGRCEMINCSSAPPMRKELAERIAGGGDDASILMAFAAKYGPRVLSVPPARGWFNYSAWITPFAVLAAGGVAIAIFLKRLRPAAAANAPAVDVARYEGQIEEELRKLTPED
jgi:cytochrome c-type biogenesis protein CcmH